jgi:hypothetical protein
VFTPSLTKYRCQTRTRYSKHRQAFVKVSIVAVVGVRHVKVESRLDQIAPEQNLSRGFGTAVNIATVLTRHHDHEVLATEVRGVGVGGVRTRSRKTRSIECAASARVHGAADVPAGRAGTGDDHAILQESILGEEVFEDDLSYW